ncbi:hypothetical protein NEOLEDRAFT_863106 [Neolentinus lepideus HHB14362 ss-1]|uniref:Transmembrane protein n=1 Tax=Neolentinus lepideus HHB14362 ss-1 TaxID=1314782 RepID=A0A165USD2_9AGAM|nr:hypothetical protein NEOLEDRAFT_863106 [Neolentinus lepideus HHB14362 ss-1]
MPVLLTLNARSPDTPVVTVTSYIGPSPTAVVSSPSPSQNIPVPSIVGGVVGGVFLAVIAVVGWTWWGKSIKRANEKKWKETREMLKTKENTRRNAFTGSGYPYLPSALMPKPDRKVKFAGSIRRSKNGDETAPLAKDRAPTPTKETFSPTGIALSHDEKQPAQKEPVRAGVVPFGSASRIPTVRWGSGGLRLEHKASMQTVGSESVYSTQSGEPHVQGSERGSRGFFSALDPRRLSTWTRSSGSVYSQPDDAGQVQLPAVQPLQIPSKVATPKVPSAPEQTATPKMPPPVTPGAPERTGTKTPPPVAHRTPERTATKTTLPAATRASERKAIKTAPPPASRAPERTSTPQTPQPRG